VFTHITACMFAKSLYRTLYTRGFSRFVTSTTAPVATGRNENYRVGFAPTGRQRLGTAHVKDRLSDRRQTAFQNANGHQHGTEAQLKK